jgi:ketosteroid isomerase-like protein
MRANTPAEIYELFAEYFSAGTIDLLLTLYQNNAVIVPALGQTAQGKDAIREVLSGFLALGGTFSMHAPVIIESGDTALLMAKWTLTGGKGPDGQEVSLSGLTSDVIREQPDGGWLFVIDCPFGGAIAG